MSTGTLYVVATPIGHLGDLTSRAAELLRRVPVVAAEDTRRTRGLLEHLGASPRLLSFHGHSPDRRVATLLEILRDGRDVALVSDAGTPAVSDPGPDLVRAVRAAGIPVVSLPGASALVTALAGSGLPADRFLFLGFIPRKGRERHRLLRSAVDSEWTIVFYEAPGRVVALLSDLADLAGPERQAVAARELTKLHEEYRTGTLGELVAHFSAVPPRGELTIVLEGAEGAPTERASPAEAARVAQELLGRGLTRRDVVERLVEQLGLSRNDAYRLVTELA